MACGMTSTPPSEHARPRILCVDDEPRVLEGLRRQLGRRFDVRTATSGASGLAIVDRDGPFAVVVSDMRMPAMDGAGFLRRVRERAVETVRILLTGYGDLQSAAAAVNEGSIFRLLSKPCPPDVLQEALAAAVQQHRQLVAARDDRSRLALELAAAENVKDEFLARVSHEIRTPLNVILGYSELLRTGGAGALTDPQLDIVGRVEAWALQLNELLGYVLFAREIAEQRSSGEPARVPLADLARALEHGLGQLQPPASLAVELCLPLATSGSAVVDVLGLVAVVRKLVESACRFAREGRIVVRLEAAATAAAVEVVVTGVAIDGGELAVIFDPLRGRSAEGAERDVPGLGLDVLSRCLSTLGGTIEVERLASGGDVLRIRLDDYRPTVAAASAPVHAPA